IVLLEVDVLLLVEVEAIVLDDVELLVDEVLPIVLVDVDVLPMVDVEELVLDDVEELDDDVAIVVLLVVVVGVPQLPVGGETLAGLAGSVPQSSSRRSYVPSRSRSTPMRVPEPSGTHVYVSSCPTVAARFRRVALVIVPSVFRSGWEALPPTYTQPRATL